MTHADALALVKGSPMASAALCIKTHRARIPHVVDRKDDTPVIKKSDGDFSRRVDMHALRRAFPERWGDFCRRHFRNSVELAAFFDTDEKTARNWMDGKHAPAGPFVARAVRAFSDAVDILLAGDC